MNTRLSLFFILFFSFFIVDAQVEKPPVYLGCEEESLQNLNACFNNKLKADILKEFRVPDVVSDDNYKGRINVVFLVNREGIFEVLYVNAMYSELEAEVRRVFGTLPKIQPATYNGRDIEERFQMPIDIPLRADQMIATVPPAETTVVQPVP